MKLKWRINEAPTGRYRSFFHRSWPYADYPDGSAAFHLRCEDSYTPRAAKSGEHPPLSIMVAVYKDNGGFEWKKLKAEAATLAEAKAIAADFLARHPQIAPPHIQPPPPIVAQGEK